MGKLVNKDSMPILTITKDIVVVFLSIVAIIVSINTCSKQKQSNELSKASNEIAKNANSLAEEVSGSSLKFNIINAEAQWGILRDSYNEIDNKILIWENQKGLKRDGKPADSMQYLETQLEKLKASEEVKSLYKIRQEKYLTLKNVSEQYKPFEERLAHIDFTLPSAPVLPGLTLRGISLSGTSIN